jgi:hypothetical protein
MSCFCFAKTSCDPRNFTSFLKMLDNPRDCRENEKTHVSNSATSKVLQKTAEPTCFLNRSAKLLLRLTRLPGQDILGLREPGQMFIEETRETAHSPEDGSKGAFTQQHSWPPITASAPPLRHRGVCQFVQACALTPCPERRVWDSPSPPDPFPAGMRPGGVQEAFWSCCGLTSGSQILAPA